MNITETLAELRKYQYVAIACIVCSWIAFFGTMALATVLVFYKIPPFCVVTTSFWVAVILTLIAGVIEGIIFIKSMDILYCPNCEKNLSYLVYDPSYSKPPFVTSYILLPKKVDIEKCPYCGVEI